MLSETIFGVVGALMFVGAGIVVVSPDSDIYPQARWFCGAVAVVGLGLLLIAANRVLFFHV